SPHGPWKEPKGRGHPRRPTDRCGQEHIFLAPSHHRLAPSQLSPARSSLEIDTTSSTVLELKDVTFRRDGKEILQRSEEHTSELQSRFDLVCRLLLEKKKINRTQEHLIDQQSIKQI